MNLSQQLDHSLPPNSVDILGVPIHSVTKQEALHRIASFMIREDLHQVATANPEFIIKAQEDAEFMRILNNADLCLADGIGLILASRWKKRPLPTRVAGSDLVYDIAALAAKNHWRLFLLGAQPGVAEMAGGILQQLHPDLEIAGCEAGSPVVEENDKLVRIINESEADILFVAFGAPAQDKWIDRNRHSLESIRAAMGVGGSLDFITGSSVRAPKWMQRIGLEWLHRLIKEPWRWRRMLALPKFAFRVLLDGRN